MDTLRSPQPRAQAPARSDGLELSLRKVEVSRKRKYQDFESMDEYPEIGAALDIYADDATLVDDNTDFLKIQTEDRIVKEEIERFFDTIEMKRFLWDIARNVAKYGDCFCENIIDLNNTEAGIQRLKILNPNFVYRKEDQYGYLKGFMQEIPKKGYGDANALGGGGNSPFTGGGTLLNLDKNQIIHFRKRTSDQNFYPYGKSILAAGTRAWKSLKMMEDAMRTSWSVLSRSLRRRNSGMLSQVLLTRDTILCRQTRTSLFLLETVKALRWKFFQALKT